MALFFFGLVLRDFRFQRCLKFFRLTPDMLQDDETFKGDDIYIPHKGAAEAAARFTERLLPVRCVFSFEPVVCVM